MSKRSKRTAMKRSLAQAHNDLDRVVHNLGNVHLEFHGVKEDYTKYLELMIKAAVEIQGHIRKFWTSAWGKCPDNLNTWR